MDPILLALPEGQVWGTCVRRVRQCLAGSTGRTLASGEESHGKSPLKPSPASQVAWPCSLLSASATPRTRVPARCARKRTWTASLGGRGSKVWPWQHARMGLFSHTQRRSGAAQPVGGPRSRAGSRGSLAKELRGRKRGVCVCLVLWRSSSAKLGFTRRCLSGGVVFRSCLFVLFWLLAGFPRLCCFQLPSSFYLPRMVQMWSPRPMDARCACLPLWCGAYFSLTSVIYRGFCMLQA